MCEVFLVVAVDFLYVCILEVFFYMYSLSSNENTAERIKVLKSSYQTHQRTSASGQWLTITHSVLWVVLWLTIVHSVVWVVFRKHRGVGGFVRPEQLSRECSQQGLPGGAPDACPLWITFPSCKLP